MGPSCNLLRVAVSKYMVTAVILEPREKRLGSKSQGGNVTARHDVATYHRERSRPPRRDPLDSDDAIVLRVNSPSSNFSPLLSADYM